jgi:hypothetical protein
VESAYRGMLKFLNTYLIKNSGGQSYYSPSPVIRMGAIR